MTVVGKVLLSVENRISFCRNIYGNCNCNICVCIHIYNILLLAHFDFTVCVLCRKYNEFIIYSWTGTYFSILEAHSNSTQFQAAGMHFLHLSYM